MENSPRLYSELVALCGQPGQWRDVRHLQTLAWMVVGVSEQPRSKLRGISEQLQLQRLLV
jgi:hypothetical protein